MTFLQNSHVATYQEMEASVRFDFNKIAELVNIYFDKVTQVISNH
jgi:hypothetical protein